MRLLSLTVALVLAVALRGAADDSMQFRGPRGLGVSTEKDLPVEWSDTVGLRWKAALPGRGLSNPVIAQGRVYVTACSGFEQRRLHVLCFDVKTGKLLWDRQFAATGTTVCHPKTNMAAPSPLTDGRSVVALFATGDLVCLDRDGDLVWYRSLVGDYPTVGNNVGMASSPVLVGKTVVVCLENVGESFVAGIDLATGENRWRHERPRGINWVTPVLFDRDGRTQVVVQGPRDLTAFDPVSGKRLWSTEGSFATMASATAGDGMIFAPGGKFTAYRPDKDTVQLLWQNPKLATGYCSPVYYQGLVYTVSAAGVVNCAEPGTGKVLWTERLDGNYAASPLAADGKLYVLSEKGLTTVLQASGEAKVLATNQIDDTFLASPVAADGAIFLRSDKFLYCIGR
ncbi:MAG: PQQ-binding-like beta-propeller repeat protein [Gemmataceae bacterium]|nr:PQQ-binding-like beta-propeller repeat protein [Gemmataceae bacterium]